jgi:hypothetical protein
MMGVLHFPSGSLLIHAVSIFVETAMVADVQQGKCFEEKNEFSGSK